MAQGKMSNLDTCRAALERKYSGLTFTIYHGGVMHIICAAKDLHSVYHDTKLLITDGSVSMEKIGNTTKIRIHL
jgi:hypothetical protein